MNGCCVRVSNKSGGILRPLFSPSTARLRRPRLLFGQTRSAGARPPCRREGRAPRRSAHARGWRWRRPGLAPAAPLCPATYGRRRRPCPARAGLLAAAAPAGRRRSHSKKAGTAPPRAEAAGRRERGAARVGASRPPPPPAPSFPGAAGGAAPGGAAGRPLVCRRPRLRGRRAAAASGPGGGGSRARHGPAAPGHPAAFLRELPAPHCQAATGCDFCSPLRRACPYGNGRKPKRALLRSAPAVTPTCPGRSRGSLPGGVGRQSCLLVFLSAAP